MKIRTCELDQDQAKYACKTHDSYYCELHYRQHISDRKPHVAFPIDIALAQPEFEQLQNEVIKRTNYLKSVKQQVASQAAQLIAKIGQTCFASIENLDSMILSYRNYTAENNFNQQELEKAKKMLKTRLKIQVDQELALKVIEEPNKKVKRIPMKRQIRNIIGPISESILELIKLMEPIKKNKREHSKEPKTEPNSDHQAMQIPSNQIIRKYGKSPRQNFILSATRPEILL
jgi:hypothetical protein